jgi:integrase/recombinase XerC
MSLDRLTARAAIGDREIIRRHLRHLELRGHKPDTISCRAAALIRTATALHKPLLEATAADLLAWRAGLSVGPASVAGYVGHAREFYRWAVAEQLRDDNPAAGLPVPKLGRRLPRPIGEDRLMTAILAAPPRIRPWLVLAGWAGLRAKEIAYLRRECVLEEARPPVLLIAADATKGRGERTVPLARFVIGELRVAGLPRQGWVFRRGDGLAGPNRPWTVSHLANDYLHGLGFADTLHSLRHRFGTMTYHARKDLRMVQELLGHAQPSTTAGYAAFDQAAAADVVDELPVPALLRPLPRVAAAQSGSVSA